MPENTELTPELTHVLYNLSDQGSHYSNERLVLYPNVPIPVTTIRPGFLIRLLEERIVARCDADGNLAPEEIRFAEELPVEESTESTGEFAAGGVITTTVPVITGESGPEIIIDPVTVVDTEAVAATKKKPASTVSTVPSTSTENTKTEG